MQQVSQHALAHQPVTSPPVQSILLTVANTVECVALICRLVYARLKQYVMSCLIGSWP